MSVILAAAVMLGGFAPHAAASPMVRPAPTPPATSTTPAPARHGLVGRASWYCCTHGYGPAELVAAAGPALRRALGSRWRGRVVRVNGIRVRLVDWCQCYRGTRHEVLVDLQPGAFRRIAALSAGIVRVEVSW